MLYRAFAARWEIMEGEVIEKRRQYKKVQAGKRGSRPVADAYDDFNAEFNVACGLVNARFMFRNSTYCHSSPF